MVKMIAERDFPLGKESRSIVRRGTAYEVDAAEVAFHEATGRGRKSEPDKSSADRGKGDQT